MSNAANENAHPDSYWGHPSAKLVERYPAFTAEALEQWQLAARLLGQKFSQNPRTRLSALIINPQNELVAVGVNNFIKGVPLSETNMKSDELRYAFGLCAEQGAITACAKSPNATSAGNIMITPLTPCENCAKSLLSGEIAALVADPQEINPGLLQRWGRRFEVSKMLMDQAESPAPLLVIASRVPEGLELKLDLDRLPLNDIVNGKAFAKPISFESLVVNQGRASRPAPALK